MKEKTFKRAKSIVGIVLFIASAYLTNLTFSSFAKFPSVTFFAWIVVAAIVALLQVLSILQVKTNMRYATNWVRKSIIPIVTYALCTTVTFSGSLIFSTSTVSKTIKETEIILANNSSKIIQLENDITRMESENEVYQKQIDEYVSNFYVKLSQEVKKYKDENLAKINEARIEIEKLRLEDIEKASSSNRESITTDTFQAIADLIPFVDLKGSQLLFFILFILSCTIDFGLFTTLEPLSKGSMQLNTLEVRKEFVRYIDALFASNGERLNPDTKIEELTKIPLNQCKKYRKLLQEQMYDGKPMIVSGKGATKANFSKDDTIKLMTYFMKAQRGEE